MSTASIGVVRFRRIAALGVASAMVLAACGGSSSKSGSGGGGDANKLFEGSGVQIQPAPKGGGSDPDAGVSPVRGGKATYALEAEDTNGYCIPEASLDIAGEQVARSVYDTLTVPGADGKYHAYLAKSVTPSNDYTTWTIVLRSGVTFSDGSALTADVVKNNIDAWRGTYKNRSPLLFLFVYKNIANVAVTAPLTVTVTMAKPWVDFDAALYNQSRSGIIGQSQLDDEKSCGSKLVGTGPFVLQSWKVGELYKLTANKHYWQIAPDGKPYPYLDEIDFVPIEDAPGRTKALLAGTVDGVMHSSGKQIVEMRKNAATGKYRVITSVVNTELAYILINSTKPPFDDLSLRKAAAEAIDMNKVNHIQNLDVAPVPVGPFAPGSDGYLTDPGYPKYNPSDASKLVSAYTTKHNGEKPKVAVVSTPDSETVLEAEQYQQYLNQVGFDASIQNVQQAKLIDTAIGKNFQALIWRNHGGVDPDEQYLWWYSTSAVNFGGIKDPVIDCLFDVGRALVDSAGCLKDPKLNTDYPGLKDLSPTDRKPLYQAINRRMGSQVWNVWGPNYSPWTVASTSAFHGVFGPKLPDGSAPWRGLVNGIPTLGLWMAK